MKKIICSGLFFLFFAVHVQGQNIIYKNLYLRSNFGTQTMWDGVVMDIYGIAPNLTSYPKIPADIIYCNEGDSVVLNVLSISQKHHHTIHLHGLDVDTRNDGDPATSFELSHMQDTTYSFKAAHAGTYLYHCHVGDVVHVQMGMYGLIVVRAAGGTNNAWTGGPVYHSAYNWLMSEIDRSWHDTVPEHDTNSIYITLPKYEPEYFLINGLSESQIDTATGINISGQQNSDIYLRLANIGFYDNLVIFPSMLDAKIIDSDGRPLPVLVNTDSVWVAPGERYGVMLHPTTQFVDSIAVHYINMNTQQLRNTQYARVSISGVLGVKKPAEEEIQIYPNPAAGTLHLQCPSYMLTQQLQVTVSDVTGKELISQKFCEEISLQALIPGLYFVQISTANGALLTTRKFIHY